jgi:hypothetical protein
VTQPTGTSASGAHGTGGGSTAHGGHGGAGWRGQVTSDPPLVEFIGDRLQAQAQGRAAQIEATIDSIVKWWEITATNDAKITAPKAAEYGASDLAIMGKAMEGLYPNIDQLPPEEREKIGLEMATAFYVLGKAARLFGAYEQGRLPNDDSWFDLTVYSMMARRIRDVGYWV